jgi:hypothetical protein
MISYIKLYGPPVYEAIKTLEKIAIDMPEVCIMNPILAQSEPTHDESQLRDGVQAYFGYYGDISVERCDKIVSKRGELLGDYDFFFEWFKKPTIDQLNTLIKKIDESLKPIGCRYTIVTKK